MKKIVVFLLILIMPNPALAANNVIWWTGTAGNNWNTTDTNWKIAPNGAAVAYQTGDIVSFEGSGTGGTITMGGNVTASGIYVSGSKSYAFTGGNLNADGSAGTFGPGPVSNGKLLLGNTAYTSGSTTNLAFTGTMDLSGTTSNHFAGGIEIDSGTLRINNSAQLGATMSQVQFTTTSSYTQVQAIANAIIAGDAATANTAANTARTTGFLGALQVADGSTVNLDGGTTELQRLTVNGTAGSVNLQSGAKLIGQNNNVDSTRPGGVINLAANSVFALTAADATARYTFQNNSTLNAVNGGGVIFNAGSLFVQQADFIDNSATPSGLGGAIYSTGNLLLSDTAFSDNSAYSAGAVYNQGGRLNISNSQFTNNHALSFGGGGIISSGTLAITDSSFTGNTAAGVGGALAVSGTGTVTNTNFTNNQAVGTGGAINNTGTLTLATLAGQTMVFDGNTAGGMENAVNLGGTAPVLNVSTAAGSIIDFRDPLSGAVTTGTATVNKTGDGAMMLGGNSVFTATTGSTHFNVNAGSLHLYRANEVTGVTTAGSLDLGANSTFTLASGAKLDIGGGNTIKASSVAFANGSTLGFDLSGGTSGALLTVNAASQSYATTGNWLDLHSLVEGTYTLVDSLVAGTFSGVTLPALTVNGQVYTSPNARTVVTLTKGNTDQTLDLEVEVNNNVNLTWTGANTAIWDYATINWKDNVSVAETFVGGDIVTFDNTATQRDVTVATTATPGGMVVSGSGYTFSGGSITSATSAKNLLIDKKLHVQSGGGATFKNTVDFEGGMQIDAGGQATLADGGSFAQRMTVDNSGTVTFDRSTDYDQTGILGGTGEYVKNGTGALTLSAANTATGTFSHQAGTVRLQHDWNGSYSQAGGTLAIDDNVAISTGNFNGGAVEIAGAGTIGTTTVTTLNGNGGSLNIDLDANGTSSDSINATTASLQNFTINLNAWVVGTYTLVNAGSGTYTDLDLTLGGTALNPAGRKGWTLTSSSNNLVLTTTANNENLAWAGGSGIWNTSSTNWTGLDNTFIAGDSAAFTGGSGSVVVQASGIDLSDMTVSGGSQYTFSGGNLTGAANTNLLNTGKLTVDGAGTKAIFNNTAAFADHASVTNGATIGGSGTMNNNLTLTGSTIAPDGTFTVNGDLTMSNSTLNIDIAANDKLAVTGTATVTDYTVDLTSWANGRFVLVDAATGSYTGSEAILFDGSALSGRKGGHLAAESGKLVLYATANNENLTWNAGSGVWDYTTPNWSGVDTLFIGGDQAVFEAGGSGTVNVRGGGIVLSDMLINGGQYIFEGGNLTGQAVNNGTFTRDGRLAVSGAGTSAIFNNNIDFAAGVSVTDGALFGGSGNLTGNLSLASGAILSPGNSIGTLSVNGDVAFGSGTFFDVEVDPLSASSDLLAVTGTATLDSGAVVRHIGLPASSGAYPVEGEWLILQAASITGQFADEVDTSLFAFLGGELLYGSDSNANSDWVKLVLKRTAHFNDFANTRNQRAVAGGLASLDYTSPLYNAIIGLQGSPETIAHTYDELSGEMISPK